MNEITKVLIILLFLLTACQSPTPSAPESGLILGGGFGLTDTAEMTSAAVAPTTAPAPFTREVSYSQNPDSPDSYTALNHEEVVGVWISYIELSSVLTKKTGEQFRKSYAEMMTNCQSLGINTVYVHLRPFGDALYDSDFYPWSKYVTGTLGKAPDFDPLEIMTEESHKKNISFHGWINPMRIQTSTNIGRERTPEIERVSEEYRIGKWYRDESLRGKYLCEVDGNWFLNPAYPEVLELIADGAREIVEKYDVDGIHIDDYFYPPATTAEFDSAAYEESSFASLDSFRKFNCNKMVNGLYEAVKKGSRRNAKALFGISPQGNIENNYELFADVGTWCAGEGYADYIVPQFYYGFNNETQSYTDCINEWQELLAGSDISMLFGLAVYKVGVNDPFAGTGNSEWIEDSLILKRQIELARGLGSYGGVVFYSYNYLFNPTHLTKEIQEEIAAVQGIL